VSIKLVALDLDGTLFNDTLVISPRVRAAIRRARDKGIVVTIATGRMFGPTRAIAHDLGIEEPLICYQGAMVRHSATGQMLYHKTVPLDLAHAIIEETSQLGLHLNLYLNDEVFVSESSPEAQFYSRINMEIAINEVGPLGPWLDTQGGAEPTKLVIVTDATETDRTLALFTERYGEVLQVTKSHARFTEFTNAECSKGRTLAFVARYCGVERDEVMAIGDGHNDLDMITWAGHGVAMPSSPAAVIEAARTVAATLAYDGAARAIERYVLGQDDEPENWSDSGG
jgi:Cof subfamily protein (haloacid dehalogenase superfamily)